MELRLREMRFSNVANHIIYLAVSLVCSTGISLPRLSSSMAPTPLPLNATLEAYAHSCTASRGQELLARTPKEWLRTHGHIAVARAMEFNKDPLGVMHVLLDNPEVQVNLRDFGDEERNTLLHLVMSMHDDDENEENRKGSLLLVLKRPDLDPNLGNSKGDTPLHSFARASSAACIDILLDDRRVNVQAVNHNKQTALHVTCDASSKETSDLIARKIIKSARSTVESFPQFLRKQDRFGNTALHYAAARGLENVVHSICEAESLSSKHVLASKKNHRGNLAIHFAAMNGHRGVVERMLVLLDDSHVVNEVVVNVKDHDGFGLVHHAVRSGDDEILRLCIQRLPLPTRPTFDLYMELLAVAPNKNIADFLLESLRDEETVKKVKDKKDDEYLAKLLHFAVTRKHEKLVELIVKWYPKQAVVAMHEALDTGNETIQAVLRDHPEVRRDVEKMHKNYTHYVTAAHAILVVSVLIVALTFGHCLSSVEAARYRKDILELKDFGGLSGIKKFQLTDFFYMPRLAFMQAMVATILAAFAALPFSFAFFFHEAVDDSKVKRLLCTTRVLIVTASYFLVLSLEALFFSFVCSQFIAPSLDNKCFLACQGALVVFSFSASLFLLFNLAYYWRHRAEGNKRGAAGNSVKSVEMREISIT